MMPLACLLQGLLLVLCHDSSGSVVKASCLSRYAHYTSPQPLVLQAHLLQRVLLVRHNYIILGLLLNYLILNALSRP